MSRWTRESPRQAGRNEGSRPLVAGYSATPQAAKLGIGTGSVVHLIGAPDHYRDLLTPLPEGASLDGDSASSADVIHLFCDRRSTLEPMLEKLRGSIRSSATVWVSWPKKASKVPTDLTEDVIREAALPLGFVDVKVCAIDTVWSGLKLVVRKSLR